MQKPLMILGGALVFIICALLYALVKCRLGNWMFALVLFTLVLSLTLVFFLCLSIYHGLATEVEFHNTHIGPAFFVFKHIQGNYGKVYGEVEAFEHEARKITKVQELLDSGEAYCQALFFDSPSLLRDPEQGRACIGIMFGPEISAHENFLEQLEGNPGLTNRVQFGKIKALMAKFPNKSRMSITIARIKVQGWIDKRFGKNNEEYKEVYADGRLRVPLGEVYDAAEIKCYIPLGEEGNKLTRLTQFKEPAYHETDKSKVD